MSVSTGTPTSFLTRSSTTSPSSSPGPRKLALLERLALSKLALNTYARPSASHTPLTCRAMARHCSADSITQGPAMTKRGALNIMGEGIAAFLPLPGTPGRGLGRGASHADQRGSAILGHALANGASSTCHAPCPSPPPSPRRTGKREYGYFFPSGTI